MLHKSFPTLMLPEILQHPHDFRLLKALFIKDKKCALLNLQHITFIDPIRLESQKFLNLSESTLMLGCLVGQDLALLKCQYMRHQQIPNDAHQSLQQAQVQNIPGLLTRIEGVEFCSVPWFNPETLNSAPSATLSSTQSATPPLPQFLVQACFESDVVIFETEFELKVFEESLPAESLERIKLAAFSQAGFTLSQLLLNHDYFLDESLDETHGETQDKNLNKSRNESGPIIQLTPNQNKALSQGLALSFALSKQPEVTSKLIQIGGENCMRNQELKALNHQVISLQNQISTMEQQLNTMQALQQQLQGEQKEMVDKIAAANNQNTQKLAELMNHLQANLHTVLSKFSGNNAYAQSQPPQQQGFAQSPQYPTPGFGPNMNGQRQPYGYQTAQAQQQGFAQPPQTPLPGFGPNMSRQGQPYVNPASQAQQQGFAQPPQYPTPGFGPNMHGQRQPYGYQTAQNQSNHSNYNNKRRPYVNRDYINSQNQQKAATPNVPPHGYDDGDGNRPF